MGWTLLLIVIILAGAIAVTRMLSSGPTRAELKEQIKASHDREPIDIHELVRQEFEELGLGRFPGSEGVDMSVLLRVWHRDEATQAACTDGLLHYQRRPGVTAQQATDGDLRLVCVPVDGEAPPWAEPVEQESLIDEADPAVTQPDAARDDESDALGDGPGLTGGAEPPA